MAVQLVTQAEYAKHRGCSAVAVHKAVKAGRISLIDGKIDPAVADVQWQRNTRARSRNVGGALPPLGGGAGASVPQITLPRESYDEARRRQAIADAGLAELRLAEQSADLLRAATVHAMVAKLAAGLREGLLQIPPRLAPVLAAESDAAIIQDTLAAALRQVLEQVATEAPATQA